MRIEQVHFLVFFQVRGETTGKLIFRISNHYVRLLRCLDVVHNREATGSKCAGSHLFHDFFSMPTAIFKLTTFGMSVLESSCWQAIVGAKLFTSRFAIAKTAPAKVPVLLFFGYSLNFAGLPAPSSLPIRPERGITS